MMRMRFDGTDGLAALPLAPLLAPPPVSPPVAPPEIPPERLHGPTWLMGGAAKRVCQLLV